MREFLKKLDNLTKFGLPESNKLSMIPIRRFAGGDRMLHYIDQGRGEVLVLLHGNGESLEYFAHQIAYFSHTHRVIALDTRGHGHSPRGDKPFTLSQFAEDLKQFLDEKKIKRAHILGFSDGGNIALLFALRYPERVLSLILNGANLDPKGVKWTVQAPVVAGYHVAKLFARKSAGAKQNAEMLGLMVNEPHIAPMELSRLLMPALVIAGDRDMIKDAHTRLIADSLPQGQLVILPGDHFVANKNPTVFNDAVERFLQEVG